MSEYSDHAKHELLELHHNLGALDIESIKPWSVDVIPEHRYLRLREAAALAAFKLEAVDSLAEKQSLEDLQTELLDSAFDASVDNFIDTIIQEIRKTINPKWTHGA